MNTEPNIDERLWNYIDGSVNAEEKSFIEALITSDQAWKSKYSELLEVHQLMQNHLELDEPSMRFTQNVMEEIARLHIAPATRTYINKKVIWSIGGFFIIMLVGFFFYILSQINWAAPGTDNYQVPIDMNKLDWSKVFNSAYTNIFILVNVILGLMLLDMYLNKRRAEFNKSGIGH
jgi:hypothetical protein